MFGFKLRTLLIVLPTLWNCAVAGAVLGLCAGRMTLPNSDNLLFAMGWGTTVGLIPMCGVAAILADDNRAHPQIVAALAAAIAIASGLSLFIFTGMTV